MRQYKKPMKFYYTIFGLTSLIVLGYSLYLYFTVGATAKSLWILWILPFFFTMIYFGGDSLMQFIMVKKKKPDPEADFLTEVGKRMAESKTFLIEEYRRLQNNDKFQSVMKMAFEIYQSGETEIYTIDKLKRKFKPDSVEGRATVYAIQVVEEKLAQETKSDDK